MDPLQTTPTLPSVQTTTANTNVQDQSDRAVLSSDFNTFLQMLTVQVENQDPLNPVDATDYATQLATFSSVEQQVLTNELLRDLSSAFGGNGLAEASAWIGMEALAQAPVSFDGDPVHLRPEIADGADSAALIVRDASGDVVRRITLNPAQSAISWDGLDAFGSPAAQGIYRMEIESYAENELIDTSLANVYSRIEEARLANGSVVVRLSDGTEIPASDIEGLRSPT